MFLSGELGAACSGAGATGLAELVLREASNSRCRASFWDSERRSSSFRPRKSFSSDRSSASTRSQLVQPTMGESRPRASSHDRCLRMGIHPPLDELQIADCKS